MYVRIADIFGLFPSASTTESRKNCQASPAEFHEGSLLDIYSWDEKEWGGFYTTCVYCLGQYLKHGLKKFDHLVLQERQLLNVVYRDQMLLNKLTRFIEELVKNDGVFSKEEVAALCSYHPEFERFT